MFQLPSIFISSLCRSTDKVEISNGRLPQSEETKIHVLIDEFPQEFLTMSYVEELEQSMAKYFADSTVVLALQSVDKIRELSLKGKQIHSHFRFGKS